MPIHRRGRIAAFDMEAVAGTAETITAADGTVIFENPEIEPVIDVLEREIAGALGYHQGIVNARGARVVLPFRMVGSGTNTAAPAWGDLLTCSGMTGTAGGSSVAWVPVLGSTNAATCALFKGGAGASGDKRTAAGTMFNFTLDGVTGQSVLARCEGMGVYFGQTNVTVINPTYLETPKPPIIAGATMTIGGTAHQVSAFTLDMGNQVVLRESPNAVDADSAGTGYIAAWIANCRATLTVDPEKELANTHDTTFLAGGTAAVVITWGTTAGNKFRITMAQAQIIQPVGLAEREGREVDSLTFLGTGVTPVQIASE